MGVKGDLQCSGVRADPTWNGEPLHRRTPAKARPSLVLSLVIGRSQSSCLAAFTPLAGV